MPVNETLDNTSFDDVFGVPIERLLEIAPDCREKLEEILMRNRSNIEAARERAPELAKIVHLIIGSRNKIARTALGVVQEELYESLRLTQKAGGSQLNLLLPLDSNIRIRQASKNFTESEIAGIEYWHELIERQCIKEVITPSYLDKIRKGDISPGLEAAYAGSETLYFLTMGAQMDLAQRDDIPA